MPSLRLVSWTSNISSLLRSGHAELGLREFSFMYNSGLKPNEFGFSLALKAARLTGEIAVGKLIHGCTVKSGLATNAFCSTAAVDMYAKCRNMDDARRFFHEVPIKCEALWNTLIDGHARTSNTVEAIVLFHQMLLSLATPNSFTYTILIKLCAEIASIAMLRFFHGRCTKSGFDGDNFVGGALVDVYASLGEVTDACRVFWSLGERDHVVWSMLLAGFRHNGDTEQGLDLYLKFISEGHRLDQHMFASMFNFCSYSGKLELGLQMHCSLAKSGFGVDSFVGSALIEMYASLRMTTDACRVFRETRDKNEVIFGSMIRCFVSDSDYMSALELISEMRQLSLMPDYSTLNCLLRTYASLGAFEEGRVVHGMLLKTVGDADLVTGNNLIEMYGQSKAIGEAIKVFRAMEVHNEFSWTALISVHIESDMYEESLDLFHKMRSSGTAKPNQFTLVAVLQACSKLQELEKGKQIHVHMIKLGFVFSVYVESVLISMYARCNHLDDACKIFSSMSQRDLVSWSTMIATYVQHGHAEKALHLFLEYQLEHISFDESILSSCLSACSTLTAMEMGKCIHVCAIKTGFECNLQVAATIVGMYSKCGCINYSRKFFNKMREHNVVSYSAMLSGYAQHGDCWEALNLFEEMQDAGVHPDSVAFISVLSACSHFGLVKDGWHYFESMTKDYGLKRTENHYACMVDLLGRSGRVIEAEELIETAPFSSKTLLWKTLLGACSKHGDVEIGNRIAEKLMKLEPDEPSTYVLLSNIYASASKWDHSSELKSRIQEGHMRRTPGCSWIEVTT